MLTWPKKWKIMKMGEKILTPNNNKIEKNKLYHQKTPILWDFDIDKVLVSKRIFFGERNYNTLLVTCAIIVKFSLYKSNKKLLFSLLLISFILSIL